MEKETLIAESPESKSDSAERKPLPPITTGEKWFSRLRFVLGESFILFFTAILAYSAKYHETWGSMPNPLKWLQGETKKMSSFALKHLRLEHNSLAKQFSEAVATTLVTFHGGNLFAPFMKWIDNIKIKEPVVNYFNKNLGREGEVEAGKERLKHEPSQTWGDILKGRAAGFLTAFTVFFAADALLGKNSQGKSRFDDFNGMFAHFSTRLVHGKETAAMADLSNNKTFRYGELIGLDIFATTMSLAVWTTITTVSAMVRGKRALRNKPESANLLVDEARNLALSHVDPAHETPTRRRFAEGKNVDHRSRVSTDPALEDWLGQLALQKPDRVETRGR